MARYSGFVIPLHPNIGKGILIYAPVIECKPIRNKRFIKNRINLLIGE